MYSSLQYKNMVQESLHILKDIGMTNEAALESMRPIIRPVIRPLSIHPVVRADIKG
jgi:hypothetical protein